jgi:hypothetical protein
MTAWRPAAAWAGAVLALGYLGAMVVTGAMPVQRQLAGVEPNGVLRLEPEQIRRVELARGGDQLTLLRADATRWTRPDGSALDEAASSRVSTAIRMLHRSPPVREMAAEELAGVDIAPFGLDAPRVVATLYTEGDRPVLTARFGARNPDDFLQYMRLDGDRRIYLMSRFIGEEWAGALAAALDP